MDQKEATKLVQDAIAVAVAGDAERAADSLTTLGQNSDEHRMYGVCCAIAEAGKIMLGRIYGDQMALPEQGDVWVLEELKPGAFAQDPPKAFAARFLVAYCNGDQETTLALFRAALLSEGDQYADSVCALLADVAGLTRLALQQQDGGSR